MEEMKLKTKEIASAYQVLSNANYDKMADEDKIKVWKITRAVKPIAVKYEEDKADAQKSLITDKEFPQKLLKAQQYVMMKRDGKTELPMTDAEFASIDHQYINYNKLLSEALKEFEEKEVELKFEPLSEEAFSKLMASNNWTLKMVESIDFIVK